MEKKIKSKKRYRKPEMKKEFFAPKIKTEGKLSEIIGSGFVYGFSCGYSCGSWV